MRSRFLLSFLSIALLLGLLTPVRSQGGIVVPSVRKSLEAAILQGAGIAPDVAHTVSEKKDGASVFYRIGRQQQVPVTLNERHPGYTHLPGFSFEWQTESLHRYLIIAGESCAIFLDRIRVLLYPKHSFW